MKQCNLCKEFLEEYFFGFQKRSKDGLRGECKKCRNDHNRLCYSVDKKSFLKRSKKWKNDHKDQVSQSSKRYYTQNKDKLREYVKNNRDRIRKIHLKWSKKNRLKTNYRLSLYRKLHPEARRKYEREKMKDPNFRMRKNVSTVIRIYLKKSNGSKMGTSCWKHLPYSPLQLRKYLENQFDKHMTWDNYGCYWTIDHITPQSRLPYNSFNHPNFLKCWSLSNLRPMEKISNIKKGNKI